MLDPIRRLLAAAGEAKQTKAFWQAATDILSEWCAAQVELSYKGLNESGTVRAGGPSQARESLLTDYHAPDRRPVRARFQGRPEGFPADPLPSPLEIAPHLAATVVPRS